MTRLTFSEKDAPFEVTAYVERVGEDLLVLVSGGEAHIGAVGIAHARPSLRDPGETSSTSSVFTLPGHKEDAVAKQMAEGLSKKLRCSVVVVAGMHWERLAEKDLDTILMLCQKVEERVAGALLPCTG